VLVVRNLLLVKGVTGMSVLSEGPSYNAGQSAAELPGTLSNRLGPGKPRCIERPN
jgi:hypothetical protein